MPLKVNVGLSRKVGESNYGSRGASVNVEMELESTLVGEPGKLQERIRQLFCIVRSSLAEELNGHSSGNGAPQNGNGAAAPTAALNGDTPSPGREATPRPATQSQVKALHAIARGKGVNLGLILREQFHVRRPDDLSIREASTLIDQLKQSDNGGRA